MIKNILIYFTSLFINLSFPFMGKVCKKLPSAGTVDDFVIICFARLEKSH